MHIKIHTSNFCGVNFYDKLYSKMSYIDSNPHYVLSKIEILNADHEKTKRSINNI